MIERLGTSFSPRSIASGTIDCQTSATTQAQAWQQHLAQQERTAWTYAQAIHTAWRASSLASVPLADPSALSAADFARLLAAEVGWNPVAFPLRCHLAIQWLRYQRTPNASLTAFLIAWPGEAGLAGMMSRPKFLTDDCQD